MVGLDPPEDSRPSPAPWRGPQLISYAQTAEDIRLWRTLAEQSPGFYVDVGAGHPVVGSVTKLFYEAGWSGVNIEPGPHFSALARSRPRDVNLDVAIARTFGPGELWVSEPHSGLSSLEPPENPPEGFTFRATPVVVRRLDEILDEHAAGRAIEFLKIDVQGAEAEVLASFDPRIVRPRIVVVEAISPVLHADTRTEWEPALVDAGYVHAAFDGINRFYVAREHVDLAETLAYPISPIDQFDTNDALSAKARIAELRRRLDLLSDPDNPSTLESLESNLQDARALTQAMTASLSWRVTRPLRAVRRAQVQLGARRPTPVRRALRDELEEALAARLSLAAAVLVEDRTGTQGAESLNAAISQFAEAASMSPAARESAAWLGTVAIRGRYPDTPEIARLRRLDAAVEQSELRAHMTERAREALAAGMVPQGSLDIVRDVVVVDATLVVTSDLQRGIHRVAREAIPRWIELDSSTVLARFDERHGTLTRVTDLELERTTGLRSPAVGRQAAETEEEGERVDDLLVPWRCRFVVTELVAPRHARAIASLRDSDAITLCAICYDLIPVVAPELVPRSLSVAFLDYLGLLTRADRISTISRQSEHDVRAFTALVDAKGWARPSVAAHMLPTEVPRDPETATKANRHDPPTIAVVGPHEARKNHLAVLEAAERMWQSGLAFDLLFVGAGTTDVEVGFDDAASQLAKSGRAIHLEGPVSENELRHTYRSARFSVFPSLVEGFGLPIVESLAVGTPVITSNYGSMAEIAEGGGVLVVDPRDVAALEEQMRRLLTDDELLERLRTEARRRDLGSWDDYARDVWRYFTAETVPG